MSQELHDVLAVLMVASIMFSPVIAAAIALLRIKLKTRKQREHNHG